MKHTPNLGIVGYGQMGTFFAGLMKDIDRTCTIYDTDPTKKDIVNNDGHRWIAQPTFEACDIVVVFTPISSAKAIALRLEKELAGQPLIVGGFSVMSPVCEIFMQYLSRPLAMAHCLFGPQTSRIPDHKPFSAIISPVNCTELDMDRVCQLLKSLGIAYQQKSPKEHDKKMAQTQAMAHLIGRAIIAMKMERRSFTTNTYDRLIEITEIIGEDSYNLFESMQTLNPYARSMHKLLIKTLQNIEDELYVNEDD